MAEWPEVSLGEICEFKYGRSLKATDRNSGPIAVMGSNGQVGSHDIAITKGETIVIGRKGSIGAVAYVPGPCWPIDTTYYVDGTASEQDPRWLYWQLQQLRLGTMNKSAAVPGLNREDAYRCRLRLPPLPEQRRIASILDESGDLGARGRKVADHLVMTAESLFRKSFGELSGNEKGWDDSLVLSDVAEVVSGVTKGRRTSLPTREVPYLTVANVQDQALRLGAVKGIEATEAEIQRYRLQSGDLLLTEGGDPDKLGRGALWRGELPECIHQNHVFRVRILDRSRIHPVYLSWLVSSGYGKRYFLGVAKQTTGIASINSTQLKAFPLLTPPIAIQEEFAACIAEIEALRERHSVHVAKLDELFASLQHRAFRGEL